MMINDKITYLHRVITGVMSGDVISMGIFNRLYSLGVISILNDINCDLEELSQQLDNAVNLEAISIKFDTFLNKDYWTNNWLFLDEEEAFKSIGIEIPTRTYTTEINHMTDYLPNGIKGYKVNAGVLNSFKTSMHQLCDEDRLGYREIFYSLNSGLDKMLHLLQIVKKKVQNPNTHLYEKLWEETLDIFDNDEFDKDFKNWLEDNGEPSFDELRARQKQEVYKFLNTNFLRFCSIPTGAQVKNRKLKITEDDLESGTIIPANFDVECAKFDKFFDWSGEFIITLNYERIGQYIYKNYLQFDETEFFNITGLDRILDLIHERMAKIKPNLKQYLKRYEDNIVLDLQKDCLEVINVFVKYLKKGIREDILKEYVSKLLFDSVIKLDARDKLGGQSKNTYICEIVAYMKWFNVLNPEDTQDLANMLKGKLISTNGRALAVPSIKKYIDNAYRDRDSSLFKWTSEIIEDLKIHPYNPIDGLLDRKS